MMIENNFSFPTTADDRAAIETQLADQACALWAALFAALQANMPLPTADESPEPAILTKERGAATPAPPILYLPPQPALSPNGAPSDACDERQHLPTLQGGPANIPMLFETSSGPQKISETIALRDETPASPIPNVSEKAPPEEGSGEQRLDLTVSQPPRLIGEGDARETDVQNVAVKRVSAATPKSPSERAAWPTSDAPLSNQQAGKSDEDAIYAPIDRAQIPDRSASPTELGARVRLTSDFAQEGAMNQPDSVDGVLEPEPHHPRDQRWDAPNEETRQARAPVTISQIKEMLATTAETTPRSPERSAGIAPPSEAQQQSFASNRAQDEKHASPESPGPILIDHKGDFSNNASEAKAKGIGQQIVTQLIVAARETVQTRARSLEIQLHPAELGKVRAVLQRDEEGRLSATLTVETESARHALGSGIEELRHALEQAGITTDRIEVAMDASSYYSSDRSPEQQPSREERRSTDRFYRNDSLSPEKAEPVTTDDRLISLRA